MLGDRRLVMKIIVFIIWILDIFNLGRDIYGFNLVEFLDVTLPINTIVWLVIWVLIPSSKYYVEVND